MQIDHDLNGLSPHANKITEVNSDHWYKLLCFFFTFWKYKKGKNSLLFWREKVVVGFVWWSERKGIKSCHSENCLINKILNSLAIVCHRISQLLFKDKRRQWFIQSSINEVCLVSRWNKSPNQTFRISTYAKRVQTLMESFLVLWQGKQKITKS